MGVALFAAIVWMLVFPVPLMAQSQGDPQASPEEMAGQMLMVGFRGQSLDDAPDMAQALQDGKVGGVILFDYDVVDKKRGRNIASPEQLRALTKSIRERSPLPPFIAVDQEGGRVMRLKPRNGFPDWPSAAALGDTGETTQVYATGKEMGEMLREFGINVNFAPVLDVNTNPDNPVIGKLERSFANDPEQVAAMGTAFAKGLLEAGVLPCVKHFPGHGSSREDSHYGLPDVSDTWRDAELLPFAAAIKGGVPMIMTAHLFNSHWDDEHPATLSRKVLTGMLRERLGYDGVIVSDDMQMGAITEHYGMREAMKLAVNAGVDVLLFGNNLAHDASIAQQAHGILMDLVSSGEIHQARIEEAYRHILQAKQRLPQ